MNLEKEYQQEDDHFDNLLDFSGLSAVNDPFKSTSLYDLSSSKDKFNLSERQRTREESYEEIMKKINTAKLEQTELRKTLGTVKQETFEKYLGLFQDEFDQLNEENLTLRAELKQTANKFRQDRNERLSNRSSFKVRSSINSVYGDQNKKTHSKISRNQVSPNIISKKKDPKLTESTAHLGRSQMHSPKYHKRRESQLTERKIEENVSMGISFNGSLNDDKASQFYVRESMSRQQLKWQPDNKNVFLQILSKMLKEELVQDHEKYSQIYLESTRKPIESSRQELVFINSMEQEIKQTNQKLEMLKLVINRYQSEIEDMSLNLKNIEELTLKLFQVKGKYVEMEQKCQQLISLRNEVDQKESTFREKKLQQNNKENEDMKHISSIQTLIKIFTNNPNKSFNQRQSKLYFTYYHQLKELFKWNKEDQCKRQQKLIKVKQMIENIRESRKKFNELIGIYQSRIAKLQAKINRAKLQMEQSTKSHKQ